MLCHFKHLIAPSSVKASLLKTRLRAAQILQISAVEDLPQLDSQADLKKTVVPGFTAVPGAGLIRYGHP